MNAPPIRVLLVDRTSTNCDQLRDMLRAVPEPAYEIAWSPQVTGLKEQLADGGFDLLLLSLCALGESGWQAVAGLRRALPHLPIVVLAGSADETQALKAVREGAQDYLVKGEFDGRLLSRTLRYAFERKQAESALQRSEEFFRLISENVTDLIAVIDQDGRRLYNSPSYRHSLSNATELEGTDSFAEIHPEDKERIQQAFRETLATGVGQRAEYRMVLADGAVRHIESLGSVIRDERGQPCKVVVVSRDITDRKRAMQELEETLAQLKRAHEELQAAQKQLVQVEQLEAVSTFAAGIAHEVKNPLQTILLGVDFLRNVVGSGETNATLILTEMENAARKADAVIRGLLEISSYSKRDISEHDLNGIVDQALRAVETELASQSIRLIKSLAPGLPLLRLDPKKIKHVFIKLFLGSIQAMGTGGTLSVKTYVKPSTVGGSPGMVTPAPPTTGPLLVVAELEDNGPGRLEPVAREGARREFGTSVVRKTALDLMVIKKVVELFGGMVQSGNRDEGGIRIVLAFKA